MEQQMLEDDERKEREFKNYLNEIDKKYHDRLREWNGAKSILNHFGLYSTRRPPAIRLRFSPHPDTDSEIQDIKEEVVSKYKEIFGDYADYQELD